jgi:putative peptide zinc metalloprotease protein
MLFELFAACCAALLWANTGPGNLHSLAFNMMFVASISTLVFNANPLLRYDGYYILSDLIDIPNLQSRSLSQLKYLGERYVFGCHENTSPAHSRSESIWLSVYGALSAIYRIVVYGGIILFVAGRFLLAGLIMAAVCVFSWGIRPLANFATYLVSSPKLARNRPRAIAITLTSLSLGLLLLAVVPVPSGFRAPGVLEAKTYLRVANDTSGQLVEILAASGTVVEPGSPLMRLENPELNYEISTVSAQLAELLALRKQSLVSAGDSESALLKKRLETLEQRLKRLEGQQQSLVVSAREAGTWVAPDSEELLSTWLPRGAQLGVILSPASFRFSAVVSQEEAANLFADHIRGDAEIRLLGQGGRSLMVERFEFIPFQHEKLPSAALGWLAGGEVPVSGKDSSGLQTVEPFFQIYADLAPLEGADLYHGQSGQIRFSLRGESLLTQWARKVRQLLQRRYQT